MTRAKTVAIGWVSAALLLGGCEKKEEKSPISRPKPAATGTGASDTRSATTSAPAAMPPGHPPTESRELPPGHPPVTAPAAAPAATVIESGPVSVAGLTMTPPENWIAEKPDSAMRAAQFKLRGEAGDASAVIFYFGTGQGGDAAANVQRWIGQFKNPGDAAVPAVSETSATERDGMKITFVRVTGTYAPSPMGPMAKPEPPIEDASLRGYIIEGAPGGSVFVKVTGPTSTVDAHAEAIDAFVAGAKRS
jgi:hypothetical protein